MSAAMPHARPATVAAFDRLAADYDALAGGDLFGRMRARCRAVFVQAFAPGARVLEIGCGTGLDTNFLAARGVHVTACDPSEEMVSRAQKALAHGGLDARATVLPCGLEDLPSYLDALAEGAPFDGIVSNFGALNCVAHLAPLGTLARRHLRPGGHVVLVFMARLCGVEALYFLATGRPRLAMRRLGTGAIDVPVAGIAVPTFYHRLRDVRAALGPGLRLCAVRGVGVALPPPYLERRWRQLPGRVQQAIAQLDAWLSPCPPFNRVGDHVLLRFSKDADA